MRTVDPIRGGRRLAGRLLTPALVLLVFAAAGLQSRWLRQERHQTLLRERVEEAAGVPPVLTFINVALGGFRGVVADLLWLRVSRLQEERRFVELVQLSDWITKLEPTMPEVWSYHAWNLAYNVSVLLPRAEDKWRWVRNGMTLLRDQGLAYNPRSARLHRELGWLFQHKLGMDGDRASGYYRVQWAREMEACLAPNGAIPDAGSPLLVDLASRTRMHVETMRRIEARVGPLDWRVPMAHSLYWGWRGLELAGEHERLPCRRMVYVSLMGMLRMGGRVEGDPANAGDDLPMSPNTGVLDATLTFLEETMAAHAFSGVRLVYVAVLRDGMHIRLSEGREAEARRLHARLVDFFADRVARPFPPFEQAVVADDALFQAYLSAAGYD